MQIYPLAVVPRQVSLSHASSSFFGKCFLIILATIVCLLFVFVWIFLVDSHLFYAFLKNSKASCAFFVYKESKPENLKQFI